MRAELAYLRHRLFPDAKRWDPLLAIYYLTWGCDFSCPYCSDGQGNPYPEHKAEHLPAARVVELLKIIRGNCHNLEFTGGEPLLHPEVGRVLESLPALGFQETILTTNGWHLEKHLELAGRTLSKLVVSLDTLDADLARRWYGKGPGTLERIVSAIRSASRLPKTELVVSAVATRENCRGLPEVARFAWDLGATFACYPELRGTTAPEGLRESDGYVELYEFLIRHKRQGRKVFATLKALEWMRDLADFPCHPSTLVAIAPDGSVMWPCLEIGKIGGNLFEEPDLNRLYAKAMSTLGAPPRCGNQCHSACSLGFSSILEHPSTLLREVACGVRGALQGKTA